MTESCWLLGMADGLETMLFFSGCIPSKPADAMRRRKALVSCRLQSEGQRIGCPTFKHIYRIS